MSDVKQREQALRERMWTPVERWQAILETLAWAEAQQANPKATPKSCLARQARLLASLSDSLGSGCG